MGYAFTVCTVLMHFTFSVHHSCSLNFNREAFVTDCTMALLKLLLLIHIVSALPVSSTCTHVYYHVQLNVHSCTPVPWSHCKYLKHRLFYYKNSTATFQLQLLKSGDVHPNPGPTTEHALRDHNAQLHLHSISYNRTGERIVYNREFLLQSNPAWKHLRVKTVTKSLNHAIHKLSKNRGMLHENVWTRIKGLGIQAHLRGKSKGQQKDKRAQTIATKMTVSSPSPSSIPVLISTVRKRILRISRGVNIENLKVPPRSNNSIHCNFHVCLWNAHSVRNKTTHITECVHERDIDIMFITETWLNAQDDVVIGECTPPGYAFINAPRNASTRGGGIGVLYKSSLKLMMKKSDLCFSTFEFAHITDLSCSINLFVVYRPPPSAANRYTCPDFLREFDEFVSEISLYPGKFLLLGDFNVHWEDESKNDVLRMKNSASSAGLIQHVQGSTHKQGHTLDLVFTQDDSLVKDCYIVENCISDHHMICFSLDKQKPDLASVTFSLRNYRKMDKIKFSDALHDLVLLQPEESDTNSLFDWYSSETTKLLDLYAPSKTKSHPFKSRMPWFNESTLLARQNRRKAERKWRKTRLDSDRKAFINASMDVCRVIHDAKEKFLKDKLGSCPIKEVYHIIHSLLNKNSILLPLYDSASRLAGQFSLFFVEKIKKIRDAIDTYDGSTNIQFSDTLNEDIPVFDHFHSLTHADMSKMIMKFASKSCRLDPIPTWLLKENLDHLLPLLTNMVNKSLSTGTFPRGAHSAIIKPLLKKPSMDRNDLKNYRPVSNLSFLGKLIEKAACTQLINHIESNNLFDSFQSAYRSRHSTESALVKVKNDIMFALDSNQVVLVVLLDQSAAFDTVDHKIFISRLSKRTGVRSTPLSWFESYLSGWSSQVDIAGELSNPTNLEFGLPQGSIVGPIAYSIYTLPVGDIARHHGINYHLYADDIQLYISFDPKSSGALQNACSRLQNCISDMKKWMVVNKLKLNSLKTEFFIAGSSHNLRNLPDIQLDVDGTLISPSETIRNLGVIFDSRMSMSRHISHICSTVTFYLKNISRIRRFIDQSACHNAVRSLVLSRIDYCNSLLSSIPVTQLNRVQLLQNWAARLVHQVSRDHPSQPLLHSLHWLPLKQRIIFKLLLIVYKILNNLAPKYLDTCLTLYAPSRRLRSSNDPLRLTYSITRTLAGDRTFTVTASKYWNNLPLAIRQASSVRIFRKTLKTHLFNNL